MVRAAPYLDLVERADGGPSEAWAERAIDILLEVTDAITSVDRTDVALSRLASLALRATGADRSAILVRDPQGSARLIPAAAASLDGNLPAQHERFRGMSPIDVDALHLSPGTRSAVTLPDAANSPLIPEEWRRVWGSMSLAFVPLIADDVLFGVLAVDYVHQTHIFAAGEVHLLEAIAKAAGVALRSALLVEKHQRSAAIDRRLREGAVALSTTRSLAAMLDLIADSFVSLLPQASCSIYLLSSDNASLRPAAFRGSAPPAEIRIDELPSGGVQDIRRIWQADPRRPILIANVGSQDGWEAFIPPQIRPGMLLPLPVDGEILGFVGVGRPARPFGEEEVGIAVAFADQAALALTQALMTESLEVRLKLIEGLSRLSDAVMRTSNIKAALSTLNRGVCAELGVRCTRLSFGDPALASLLGAPSATKEETGAIRAWRQAPEPIKRGDALLLPVTVERQTAGVLWVRPAAHLDRHALDLVTAIASGLGEVAYKAKLRRVGERRARELAIGEERERIARDLHDTVGQTMFGIGLRIQDMLLSTDDQETTDRLTDLRALAAQGVTDVRRAVYELSFLQVRTRGFLPSVRTLVSQFAQATGVAADLRLSGKLSGLPDEVKNALYRVAHEALVNVERHARATGVNLTLTSANGNVELLIRDDGVGLGNREVADWRSAAHFGVRTMAKTVEGIGGRFQMLAAHPRGLIILATVPLPALRRART